MGKKRRARDVQCRVLKTKRPPTDCSGLVDRWRPAANRPVLLVVNQQNGQ